MAMASFPDRQMTIEDVVGDGDRVAVRTTIRGTNSGGVPWLNVPPNGRRIEIESISIYRVAGGRVVEHWGQNDAMRLMVQLGAIQPPAGIGSVAVGAPGTPARYGRCRTTRPRQGGPFMRPPNTWMNGRIVPWDESHIHVNTDAILRGASVFEGLRAYRATASDDLLLFRIHDHMKRLFGTSMRFLHLRLPYGPADLVQGVIDLLRANEMRDDAHIRVSAYFGETEWGRESDAETGAFILAFQRPPNPKVTSGVRVTLTPWRRLSDNAMAPRVKASANYLNSRVVILDARGKGFDNAVMLNERGRVSEGPGQNIFLVRDGVLITPRTTDSILEGITRATILQLARADGLVVEEREVDATELYVADELFFAGTATEVQPIVEIDAYRVGDGGVGPVTERLRRAYFELVRGEATAPAGWLTSVYAERVPA